MTNETTTLEDESIQAFRGVLTLIFYNVAMIQQTMNDENLDLRQKISKALDHIHAIRDLADGISVVVQTVTPTDDRHPRESH